MEFIVELFRALANRERIRVLRVLVVFRELSVTEIAEATKLNLTALSGHLKVLAAAGVVWRRRSGRVVYYRLAEDAGNPVTGTALVLLRELWASLPPNKPESVICADQSDSPSNSDAALFACFTAFTHPRRLQIIRHLACGPGATVADIARRLSMSCRACFRHVSKLERRKFVIGQREGKKVTYCLAVGQGEIERRIFEVLCKYLRGLKQ